MLNVDSRPAANGRHPIFDLGRNGYRARWVDDDGAMRYSDMFDSYEELDEWFYSLNREQLNTLGSTDKSEGVPPLVTVGQRWKATAQNSDQWRALNETYRRFIAPMIGGMVADHISISDEIIVGEVIADEAGHEEADRARTVLRMVRTLQQPKVEEKTPKSPASMPKKATPRQAVVKPETWGKYIDQVKTDVAPLVGRSSVYKQVAQRYQQVLRSRPLTERVKQSVHPFNLVQLHDSSSVTEQWAVWHYSETLRAALGQSVLPWAGYVAQKRLSERGTFLDAFLRLTIGKKLPDTDMLAWLHTWETSPLYESGDLLDVEAVKALQWARTPRILPPPASIEAYNAIVDALTLQFADQLDSISTGKTPNEPATPTIEAEKPIVEVADKETEKETVSMTTMNDAFATVLEEHGYGEPTRKRHRGIWEKHVAPTALARSEVKDLTTSGLLCWWAEVFATQEIPDSNMSKLNTMFKNILHAEGMDKKIQPGNGDLRELRSLIEKGVSRDDAVAAIVQGDTSIAVAEDTTVGEALEKEVEDTSLPAGDATEVTEAPEPQDKIEPAPEVEDTPDKQDDADDTTAGADAAPEEAHDTGSESAPEEAEDTTTDADVTPEPEITDTDPEDTDVEDATENQQHRLIAEASESETLQHALALTEAALKTEETSDELYKAASVLMSNVESIRSSIDTLTKAADELAEQANLYVEIALVKDTFVLVSRGDR